MEIELTFVLWEKGNHKIWMKNEDFDIVSTQKYYWKIRTQYTLNKMLASSVRSKAILTDVFPMFIVPKKAAFQFEEIDIGNVPTIVSRTGVKTIQYEQLHTYFENIPEKWPWKSLKT